MRHACQGWVGSLALGLLFFRTHASSLRVMAGVRCGFILTMEELGCWNVVHGLVFATSGPRSWPFRVEFLVFCGLLQVSDELLSCAAVVLPLALRSAGQCLSLERSA